MIRKIFCYGSFLIELILLGYVSYCFLYEENMNFTLFVISIIMLILNIPALLISILLFGAPSNNYSEYFIRSISYNDILKENHKLIVEYKDGNVEKGALFSENSEEIMFGPEPGIQYAVKKKDLNKIIKIDITSNKDK